MSEPWWIAIIEAIVIVNVVLVLFAYLTLLERKLMGRMQLRYGPNRAGPFGLLAIFALGSIGIYGFIVGGWASESKYSILGSMRTCAQLVSYEVSLALSVLGVVILGRSLNLSEIVARQGHFLPYAVPQFVGLIVFFFAGIAETSRAPFDLPEAEQELVAGYHTEYSGMRWGLFQMAEYINLITLSGLMVTLFFAG